MRTKSPDGQREVATSNYSEMRMGSPLFGTIVVHGGLAATANRLFGEAMSFSADSRFLAVEEYVVADSGTAPHTRVVVFDLVAGIELVVHDQNPGLIKKLEWALDGSLTIHTWSHLNGNATLHSLWKPAKGAS